MLPAARWTKRGRVAPTPRTPSPECKSRWRGTPASCSRRTSPTSRSARSSLSAVTGRAEIMDSVHVGGLGGTYGGNPVACAAALGAIETMAAEDLPGRARRIGEIRLPKLAEAYPVIGDVRGRGAMIAIELVRPGTLEPAADTAAQVAKACHAAG